MKTTNIKRIIVIVLIIMGFTQSYAQMDMGKMNMAKTTTAKIQKAVCVVYPTQGNTVSGIVTFTQTDKGVKIVADIKGLTKGKHGFHIHECGDCSAVDGSSAGGHFNPSGKMHGMAGDTTSHAGDMGNLEANDDGVAHLEFTDASISFEGLYSIIGRSIIIHKSEDDMKTQPTGNSGVRIACGVIGISK